MTHYRCPTHGGSIAEILCSHVADAVEEMAAATVYLQNFGGDWCHVCGSCATRSRTEVEELLTIAGGFCFVEWAERFVPGYLERCKNLVDEFPPGFEGPRG